MDIPSLPVRCLVSRLCEQRRLRTLECRCPVRVPITCNILYNLIFWEINMCRRRGELSLMSRSFGLCVQPAPGVQCFGPRPCLSVPLVSAALSSRAAHLGPRRDAGTVWFISRVSASARQVADYRTVSALSSLSRTGRAANRNQTRTDALRLHQTETEQSHDMPHTCSARRAGRGRLTRCTF